MADQREGGISWTDETREMDPQWPRSLRDQCVAAGVAFHFKQWGEWIPAIARFFATNGPGQPPTFEDVELGIMRKVGKKQAGRLLDGRTWDEYPETRNDPALRTIPGFQPLKVVQAAIFLQEGYDKGVVAAREREIVVSAEKSAEADDAATTNRNNETPLEGEVDESIDQEAQTSPVEEVEDAGND